MCVFLCMLTCVCICTCICDCLVGWVVKVSALGVEDPGFESSWRWDFSGSSHTTDLKIGTPVATLPGAWHYRVSAGTGWPGVSILWLGEVECWFCNFYLSVAARKIVQIRPWDTLACCWDIKQASNQPTKTCICKHTALAPKSLESGQSGINAVLINDLSTSVTRQGARQWRR